MNFWPIVGIDWGGPFAYSGLPIYAQYDWFKYLPLPAVELTLTTNKVSFSQGDTLSWSGIMMPTDDDHVQRDLYVAVVLPGDKGVFTLDHHLA